MVTYKFIISRHFLLNCFIFNLTAVPGVISGYSVIGQIKTPTFRQDSNVPCRDGARQGFSWAGMVSSVSQVSVWSFSKEVTVAY